MGRGLLIIFSAAFLGACALPIQYQIASWALDGISLIATEKSLTDHGISMVAQKDCALWRGVTGNEICVENNDDSGTVLLAAATMKPTPTSQPELITFVSPPTVEPVPSKTASEPVVSVETLPAIEAPAALVAETVPAPVQMAEETVAAQDVGDAAERLLIPGRRAWSGNLDADLYYVIGSFSRRDNARQFVRGHSKLGPAVMASRLDGKEVYRVAVGPFMDDQKTMISRTIKANGLKSSWAIRIDHKDWMIAGRPAPEVTIPVAEVTEPVKLPTPVKPVVDELAQVEPASETRVSGTTTDNGNLFYVIGSFDVVENARSFATETLIGGNASKTSLDPAVISSISGDKVRHRVVVGPFDEADRTAVLGDLARVGIHQPWSIRMPLNTPVAYRHNTTNPSAPPQIAGAIQSVPGSG